MRRRPSGTPTEVPITMNARAARAMRTMVDEKNPFLKMESFEEFDKKMLKLYCYGAGAVTDGTSGIVSNDCTCVVSEVLTF